MKRGLRNITGICLLTIFLSYQAGSIFFNHTHIVNGLPVVHSHPYKHTGNGKPSHEHPFSAYFLINSINNYLSIEHKAVSTEFTAVLFQIDMPAFYDIKFLQEDSFLTCLLRAPPAA